MKSFLCAVMLMLAIVLAGCGGGTGTEAATSPSAATSSVQGTLCTKHECDGVEVIYPAPGKNAACVRSGVDPADAESVTQVDVIIPLGGSQRLDGELMIMQVGERCENVLYGRFVPTKENTVPFTVTLRIGSRMMEQESEPDRPDITAFTKGLYEPSQSAAVTVCVAASESQLAGIRGQCISR